MMRMTVLASGSKGNSAVVASSRTRVLVDAGLSCREIMRRMKAAGEDPYALDAIVITHEHADHVSGLPVMARKLNIPVYITGGTHRAWVRQMTPRNTVSYKQWLERQKREREEREAAEAMAHQIAAAASESELPDDHFFAADPANTAEVDATADPQGMFRAAAAEDLCDDLAPEVQKGVKENPATLPKKEFFESGKRFCIGDIDITPFTIPHDAADPCGFVFEAEGIRIGFATDLGYVTPNVKMALKRCDILLLESNHDLEMLREGPYPWSVKQRVLSRVGHLSNDAAAEFLTRDYDGGARWVVLAHLSESNNLPELARMAAEGALGDRLSLLGNRVLLARQEEPIESLCL